MIRRLLKYALLGGVLVIALFLGCHALNVCAGRGRLFTNVDKLPPRDAGLVLGTAARLGTGDVNPFFKYRMDAAAKVYHAGKVRHLLVSGDNRRRDYNEPVAMRDALVARGVPAHAITLDYAGLRTLDSVVRAKEIFGLTKLTIISQRDHDQRALLIAEHHGIDAVAFCARDVPLRRSTGARIHEWLARVKAVLDLYVLHTRPRHLGQREVIAL